MNYSPGYRISRCALFLLVIFLCGCNGGSSYQAGLAAERQGDASRAYDEYVRAGTQHRSGAVAQSIERVAPLAASEAESSALAAMDAGRYEDAWRMFMRTLEIQPNHPNAPQLIRQIENEHPREVAAAKADYARRGFAALAMIPPPRTALAQAEPDAARGSPRPRPTRRPEPSRPRTPPPDMPTAEQPPVSPFEQAPRELQSQRQEYLLVHTLSLRYRRYPRVTRTIDGITIRLKDTDDDLDVDLDLYDGERRIQKIRELELGHSQTFRGRSGNLFRLTVLYIDHKSRTVRVGIRPA